MRPDLELVGAFSALGCLLTPPATLCRHDGKAREALDAGSGAHQAHAGPDHLKSGSDTSVPDGGKTEADGDSGEGYGSNPNGELRHMLSCVEKILVFE